jgi:hypothetical protein
LIYRKKFKQSARLKGTTLMTKNKLVKIVLTCIYAVGICCVLYFGMLYLGHSQTISNPEVMLPMMEYERGAWALMIGLPFLIASCLSLILVYQIKTVLHKFFLFLPALLDLVLVISYWVLS